jgi:large subunit ribosomal protein L2
MPVKTFRPLTPSTRYIAYADYSDITKSRPEKDLVQTRKRTGGRNHYGRVTARGIGGGHKQKLRLVDFKRAKHGVQATVAAIEYDPGRTARLALLEYADGEKTYIIAPSGLQVGAKLMSGPSAPPELGNSLPLRTVPVGLPIHNIEIIPGRGAQMVRSAGGAATLMSRDEGYAQIRLPRARFAGSTRIATPPSGRSATPKTRTWCWAKRAVRGIGVSGRLTVVFRGTRSTIRTVAVQASPNLAAVGSS